jgi:hypothetical protein
MLVIDLREELLDQMQYEGEEDEKPIIVPFNLYVEGSYFGDSDCLF